MTQPRILVVTALSSELKSGRAPSGVSVLYGGVGKINNAMAVTEALISAKPLLVVNYGTCGRINSKLNGLVEIARVVQRDMAAMPLASRGVTPFSDDAPALLSGYGTVTCGTGDSFVTAADAWLVENSVDVVDMELFAIARVCARFGVPWRAFKFITDDANDDAHAHWNDNVAKGEDLFWAALNDLRPLTKLRCLVPPASIQTESLPQLSRCSTLTAIDGKPFVRVTRSDDRTETIYKNFEPALMRSNGFGARWLFGFGRSGRSRSVWQGDEVPAEDRVE